VSVLHPLPFFIVLVLLLASMAVVLEPKNNELNVNVLFFKLLFVLFINLYTVKLGYSNIGFCDTLSIA
jgi:hypothetical protein